MMECHEESTSLHSLDENVHLASPISLITIHVDEGSNDQPFHEVNPLHIDNIPVANTVVIEVEGYSVLDTKSTRVYDKIIKIWEYMQLVCSILILFGILGAVLLFAIWMCNPYIFGNFNDDN